VTLLEDAPRRTVVRRSVSGDALGTILLEPTIFSVPVNVPLVHQVVTAQLAARRSGTQSTKTRAEVSGGGAKPFRQKGTGNARQGSSRSPIHVGGGVALGPKPRKYDQKTPKKMVQQALRCALSDRASEEAIRLVDRFTFAVPKTKDAIAALSALECDGKVLVVLERTDATAAKSFANLSEVRTVPSDQLTAYDVLCADVVVFTDATLPGTATPVEGASAPAAKKVAAKKAAAPATAATAPVTTTDVESDLAPTEGEAAPTAIEGGKKAAAKKSPAKKVAAETAAPAKKSPAKKAAAAKVSVVDSEDVDDTTKTLPATPVTGASEVTAAPAAPTTNDDEDEA
jgi:large subunit ribosomal protein L4